MAKVAFSKLGIKENKDVNTILFNDVEIEIKKYLSIEEKLNMISAAINNAMDENGDINSMVLEAHFNMQVVFYYTNLTFTDKQKENLVKLYDLLKGSGLMDAVIDAIGFDNEEYYDSYRGCKSTANEIMTKKQSARGIMEDIVANYSNMSFDTAEMQKNLSDPNNLTLLKNIMDKLG
jgi:hypothetical protein